MAEDDEKSKEMAVRRQKESAKSYLQTGDEFFINGKLNEAWEQYVNVQEVLRKMEPKVPRDIRFKKALTAEIGRRISSVRDLIPKEKKKDPMEALRERRLKEAQASAVDGEAIDPEVLVAKARRELRETCDRIRRQINTTLESRIVEDQYLSSSDDASIVSSQHPDNADSENRSGPLRELSNAEKVAALSVTLEKDLQARKPVIKLPKFVYDGVRGIQQVGEDDFSNRAPSPVPPLASERAHYDNTLPGASSLFASGASVEGDAAQDCSNGLGGDEEERLVGEEGPAERLRHLVGPSVVSKEVDAMADKSLELAILRELEGARRTSTAAKRTQTAAVAPYTVPQFSEALLVGVDEVSDHAQQAYALTSRPVVGRRLRQSLGVKPASTLPAPRRVPADDASKRRWSDGVEQSGEAFPGDIPQPGGGLDGGSLLREGASSSTSAPTTRRRVLSQIREAKSESMLQEYQLQQRMQGVSLLRPESVALAVQKTTTETLSGDHNPPAFSALSPSPPSESDVDPILRLPRLRSHSPLVRKVSKYEASAPPPVAPTPPTSVHSLDELSLATTAVSPPSPLSPHSRRRTGNFPERGTLRQGNVSSAVERMRQLASDLNADHGVNSQVVHSPLQGSNTRCFAIARTQQPLLFTLGNAATFSVKDQEAPAASASRIAAGTGSAMRDGECSDEGRLLVGFGRWLSSEQNEPSS